MAIDGSVGGNELQKLGFRGQGLQSSLEVDALFAMFLSYSARGSGPPLGPRSGLNHSQVLSLRPTVLSPDSFLGSSFSHAFCEIHGHR